MASPPRRQFRARAVDSANAEASTVLVRTAHIHVATYKYQTTILYERKVLKVGSNEKGKNQNPKRKKTLSVVAKVFQLGRFPFGAWKCAVNAGNALYVN